MATPILSFLSLSERGGGTGERTFLEGTLAVRGGRSRSWQEAATRESAERGQPGRRRSGLLLLLFLLLALVPLLLRPPPLFQCFQREGALYSSSSFSPRPLHSASFSSSSGADALRPPSALLPPCHCQRGGRRRERRGGRNFRPLFLPSSTSLSECTVEEEEEEEARRGIYPGSFPSLPSLPFPPYILGRRVLGLSRFAIEMSSALYVVVQQALVFAFLLLLRSTSENWR